MLAEARKKLAAAGFEQRVELLHADALELPIEDQSFDLVVIAYMLDLLPRDDIPRALTEVGRVLRPGGRIVLSNMTIAERPRHRIWDALYARTTSRRTAEGLGRASAHGARIRPCAARVHLAVGLPD